MKTHFQKSLSFLLFVSVILIGIFYSTSTIYAATTSAQDRNIETLLNEAQARLEQDRETCSRLAPTAQDSCYTNAQATYESALQDASAAASDAGSINWNDVGTSVFKFASKAGDVAAGVLLSPVFGIWSGVLYITSAVLGIFTYLFAALFDMAITLSVSNFRLISDSSGILITWSIIKNLINISFIFILLYISISIILGNFGPKKKSTVASVIISAVFINFSLFFTKIAIDFGNYIAVELSNKITVPGGNPLSQISALIMNSVGGGSIFSWDNITFSGQVGTIAVLTIQNVFLGILIWAFLYASILLVGRMVMLIILMALSPIGFVGDAIPWLKEKSDEWRKNLIGQIAVAPVFLFFIIVTLEVNKGQAVISDTINSSLSNTLWGSSMKLGAIINYSITIALLTAGIKMTKKLSGEVADWVGKIGKAILAGIALAVTGGVAAFGASGAAISAAARTGQMTMGMRATRAARGVFTGGVDKEKGLMGMIGRQTRSSIIGSVKDITNKKVDLGKLQKDYNKMIEDEEKRVLKEVNEIGPAKAEEKLKQAENVQANIAGQAAARLEQDSGHTALKDENKKITETIGENNKVIGGLQDELKKLEEERKKDPLTPGLDSKVDEAKRKITEEQLKLKENTEKLNQTKADQEKYKNDFLKKASEDIALEMGTSISALADAVNKAKADIVVGQEAQNRYATEIANGNWAATGLTASSRAKVSDQIRALKGKQKDTDGLAKELKKLLQKEGELPEEGGEDKKKSESKETTDKK